MIFVKIVMNGQDDDSGDGDGCFKTPWLHAFLTSVQDKEICQLHFC